MAFLKLGICCRICETCCLGQQQPSSSQPQHPMRQSSQDLKDKAKQLQDKIKNKGGMIPIVVHGAKLVCSETIPAKKSTPSLSKTIAPRLKAKRWPIFRIKTRQNIKPWPCKCKRNGLRAVTINPVTTNPQVRGIRGPRLKTQIRKSSKK